MSSTGTLVYVLGLVLVFYLIFYRPQKRQQEKRNEVLSQLQVGEEIFTIGGILGTITEIGDETVKINVGNGVEIEFTKTAIGGTKKSLIKDHEEVNIDDLDEYMDEEDKADFVANDETEDSQDSQK